MPSSLTVVVAGVVAEVPLGGHHGIRAQDHPGHHNVRGVDRVHVAAGQGQVVVVAGMYKGPGECRKEEIFEEIVPGTTILPTLIYFRYRYRTDKENLF
jgi:hypothetical protein